MDNDGCGSGNNGAVAKMTTMAVAAMAMTAMKAMAAAMATAAGIDNNQLWHQRKLRRRKQQRQ